MRPARREEGHRRETHQRLQGTVRYRLLGGLRQNGPQCRQAVLDPGRKYSSPYLEIYRANYMSNFVEDDVEPDSHIKTVEVEPRI